MAQWTRNKVDSSEINGGNEYEKKDRVSRQQLNSIVNNSLYASDIADTANTKADTANTKSDNAVATANEALEQARSTGTRVTVGGEFQSTFDADTKLTVVNGEVSIQKINLGSVVITPITTDTGERGIGFSIPETNDGGNE